MMSSSMNKRALPHRSERVKRVLLATVVSIGLTVAGGVTSASLGSGVAWADTSRDSGQVGQETSNDGQCRGSNESSQGTTETVGSGDDARSLLHWSNCDDTSTSVRVSRSDNGSIRTGDPVCVPARTDKVVAEYNPNSGRSAPYIDGAYIEQLQRPGC